MPLTGVRCSGIIFSFRQHPFLSPLAALTRLLFVGILSSLALRVGAEALPMPAPDSDLVGNPDTVLSRAGDTLLDIARERGYGYEEVKRANPKVDPWLPGEATAVVLPGQRILPDAPRQGIVVNLAEMRLYYFPKPAGGEPPSLLTYPIGIGKEGWQAPTLAARISAKTRDPAWRVPESIRREHAQRGDPLPAYIPPGDNNPLGDYALRIADTDYLIHGSNRKYGIGMRVSHGCIRMEADAIAELFQRVPVGTPVRIVDQPYKVGIENGRLYLEAHPPLAERRAATGKTAMVAALIQATEAWYYQVDWEKAFQVVEAARGVPVAIGTVTARRDAR